MFLRLRWCNYWNFSIVFRYFFWRRLFWCVYNNRLFSWLHCFTRQYGRNIIRSCLLYRIFNLVFVRIWHFALCLLWTFRWLIFCLIWYGLRLLRIWYWLFVLLGSRSFNHRFLFLLRSCLSNCSLVHWTLRSTGVVS